MHHILAFSDGMQLAVERLHPASKQIVRQSPLYYPRSADIVVALGNPLIEFVAKHVGVKLINQNIIVDGKQIIKFRAEQHAVVAFHAVKPFIAQRLDNNRLPRLQIFSKVKPFRMNHNYVVTAEHIDALPHRNFLIVGEMPVGWHHHCRPILFIVCHTYTAAGCL